MLKNDAAQFWVRVEATTARGPDGVSVLELKYNKFYVGLAKDGQPHNFVVSRPRKNALMLTIRLL
jgi:hypothetical protein